MVGGKTVLVVGGLGYVGSHVVVDLLNSDNSVIVVDNLCNSDEKVVEGIKRATGKQFKFFNLDICDFDGLSQIVANNRIDCVVHFAALKSVGMSLEFPLEYYANNIGGLLSLLRVMQKYEINKLVFSSSATVYGSPKTVPIREDFQLQAINPYGYTKVIAEQIICDYARANDKFGAINLRYFNPVGAHASYCIGENPKGKPNNLMPLICNVALGAVDKLSVFGSDYDTEDGTCIRDYIHVVDLSKGHLCALDFLLDFSGVENINLGTGKGATVLELIREFEVTNNVVVPFEVVGRRDGDTRALVASVQKAKDLLGWSAELSLKDMCKDHYTFARKLSLEHM